MHTLKTQFLTLKEWKKTRKHSRQKTPKHPQKTLYKPAPVNSYSAPWKWVYFPCFLDGVRRSARSRTKSVLFHICVHVNLRDSIRKVEIIEKVFIRRLKTHLFSKSWFISVSLSLSLCLCLSLSVSLSRFVSLCVRVCLSLSLSLSGSLSVSLSLSGSVSTALFVCVSVCLCVSVSLCLSLFLCLCFYMYVVSVVRRLPLFTLCHIIVDVLFPLQKGYGL